MKHILTTIFTLILFLTNAQEPKALFYLDLDSIIINKSDSIFYIKSDNPNFIIDSSYTMFNGSPRINKSNSKQLSLYQLFMIRTYPNTHFVIIVYYHKINELKSNKFGIEYNK